MQKPRKIPGLFISIHSIAVWLKLNFKLYFLSIQPVDRFWDLTCDFWAKFEENIFQSRFWAITWQPASRWITSGCLSLGVTLTSYKPY
jgi:hypothetical protein